MEKFDVLTPPSFKKSGKVKNLAGATRDGDWLGGFNLWIVQDKPRPVIIYQQRSFKAAWMPGKLDVSTAGHYSAGESVAKGGLREVKEELGKTYQFKDLTSLGRKLNVGVDTKGNRLNRVGDIFMVRDNAPLDSYILQKEEVEAIFVCPLKELLATHRRKGYSFTAQGVNPAGQRVRMKVSKDSFPYNWDNYHFKMILLAERFLKGEKNLMY